MTNHPYLPPPRRLERSTDDRIVGGVCGGVARYVNLDPTLVRVLTVAVTLFTGGVPLALYLLALFLMPEENRANRPPQPTVPGRRPSGAPGPWPTPPTSRDQAIWGTEGAPWEQPQQGAPPPGAPEPDPFRHARDRSAGEQPPTPS